jgi:hypothetical protein
MDFPKLLFLTVTGYLLVPFAKSFLNSPLLNSAWATPITLSDGQTEWVNQYLETYVQCTV